MPKLAYVYAIFYLLLTPYALGDINQLKAQTDSVVIYGAGIGGLTAAHELAERGYKVFVIEADEIPGGKARSIYKPGTGSDLSPGLPGEHGFRIFPGAYFHINDTTKRIPTSTGSVFDNFVLPETSYMSRDGGRPTLELSTGGANIDGPKAVLDFVRNVIKHHDWNSEEGDLAFFATKLLQFITSSKDRRKFELENVSWWDYIEADSRSINYQRIFGGAFTKTLAALKPKIASAQTVGELFTGMFLAATDAQYGGINRTLNGPTNEVWIDPWVQYLESLDVEFIYNAKVLRFNMSGGSIESTTVQFDGEVVDVKAKHHISALPVEVMTVLMTEEMLKVDGRLRDINELRTDVMGGLQLYLDSELELPGSHVFLLDSPWSLAAVYSQDKFWADSDLGKYGDPRLKGIISMTFGDADTPGIVFGKTLRQSTLEEIYQEMVAQLSEHLEPALKEKILSSIFDYNLDPSLSHKDGVTTSSEPLFINSVGSRHLRPNARTRIPNFYLSADYVNGNFIVSSTMEAANEAGRMAAIAVLDADGHRDARPQIYETQWPRSLERLQAIDEYRYRNGRPHLLSKKIPSALTRGLIDICVRLLGG